MTRLEFMSPDACAPEVELVSPLRHVDAEGVFEDVSSLGKLEVRGNLAKLRAGGNEDLLPLGPNRVLLVTDGSPAATRERLVAAGYRVYDMTGALAALEFEGEDLFRRLTELDPRSLPAVVSIARGTTAVLERRGGERFRVFVPQELGHFVAETVVELAQGLAE